MLARPYDRLDARGCDEILGKAHGNQGITTPGVDTIYVVGELGRPSSILVYREAAYIHELECGHGARARLQADALANYAVASARAKDIKSAVFLVRAGNDAMHRWAESIGAIKQTEPGDTLYLLTPP
jgi:hypothetical protein